MAGSRRRPAAGRERRRLAALPRGRPAAVATHVGQVGVVGGGELVGVDRRLGHPLPVQHALDRPLDLQRGVGNVRVGQVRLSSAMASAAAAAAHALRHGCSGAGTRAGTATPTFFSTAGTRPPLPLHFFWTEIRAKVSPPLPLVTH